MIKETVIYNHAQGTPFEEIDQWYFMRHVELSKMLPRLVRYVTYTALHLPENDMFQAPQFYRMEEFWWPDKAAYERAKASDANKRMVDDIKDPESGSKVKDYKSIVLEEEINILQPQMTGKSHLTMNELNGIPHVKTQWPFSYLDELGDEQGEEWYLNHHTLLAARCVNFIKYVTYTPATDLAPDPGFARFTEHYYKDWQSWLHDAQTPRGQETIQDNINAKGEWRLVNQTPFLDYPHMVGNHMVFI